MLAVKDRPSEGLGSWKMRRRFMWIISIFCMHCIAWIMYHDKQGPVDQTIIMWAFLCLGGIVGSYVFGAAWQDINFKRFGEDHEHSEHTD